MLNQGAVVYAGDRVRLKMQLTALVNGAVVPVPIPPDVEIVWREGQMTPGGNLVIEYGDARHDTLTSKGGPAEVVVLVDKASQVTGGQVRVQCQATRKDATGAYDVYIVQEFKMATQPGQRQPTTPQPPATGVTPTGMVLTAELVPATPLPGK